MRTRVFVLAGIAVAGAAAIALSQQHTGGQPQARSTSIVMSYGGPRGLPSNEEGQPARLGTLPAGVTIQMIQQGDAVFHGAGGCVTCHGADALGMPDAGSALTTGVHFIPPEFPAIDSLVTAGIAESVTRSSIAMPPRGASSNLTADQIKQVAAYVWAIATTRGEPWPGGHKTHGQTQGSTGET